MAARILGRKLPRLRRHELVLLLGGGSGVGLIGFVVVVFSGSGFFFGRGSSLDGDLAAVWNAVAAGGDDGRWRRV